MKNKLFNILLFIFCILIITGCNNKLNNGFVSIEVKEDTLTNTGVTLIMTNNSVLDYSYGEPYYIEKEVDGEWVLLETIHDLIFNLPAWGLEANESVEIHIDWEYGYGKLETGKYRIVKQIFEKTDAELHDSNIVSFNVYAEFLIDGTQFEYEKAMVTEIELKTEINTMDHGNSEEEFVEYKTYIKNNKLYARNLKTNEEKMIFDKEPVKNIATRDICCTGNAYLLILTIDGNVYMSEDDSNYNFSFNFPFKKLNVKDIVSFKLIPSSDYDIVMDLYGVNSKGEEILLHKIN